MPINANGLYVFEDIAFCNTAEFSRSAQHFKKHNVYTFAPPDSQEYKDFWDLEETRRKNGMTMPGKLITVKETRIIDNHPRVFEHQKLQDVTITGEHYGFLNYGRILRTKDVDNLRNVVNPDSHLLKHSKKVGKKDMDFPSFQDGQYHWMKAKDFARNVAGLHIINTKARRKGYSYMEGWDAADTINLIPYSTVLLIAYDLKYITKGTQLMPMAKSYLDFLELHTDFKRHYLLRGKEEVYLGYKDEGSLIEKGYRSRLIAASAMNNPDAAIGKDAIKIKVEEIGKFPNLKEMLEVTLSTMETGDFQTGFMTLFGTGGTDEANWRDAEEIFYNPEAFGCMAFENIWDDDGAGTSSGFFHPHHWNLEPHMDEHGNSDIAAANKSTDSDRDYQKTKKTPADFVKYIGQRARTPKEAFASGTENIFPTAELLEQKNRVERDPDFKYFHRRGQLVRTNEGVKFKTNEEFHGTSVKTHEPIFNYPLNRGQNPTGCYVEWFSPWRDPKSGKIPNKLYRIWHDPYAVDKDTKEIKIKDSLGATYVYQVTNNFTPHRGDILVACYVGRPSTTDEYNENLLRMAEYWNAEVFFENDRGDVKGYFGRHNALHRLADEPDLEWAAELKGTVKRGKGINMTEKRKANAAQYLRDWLVEKRGTDANGNVRMNLHYIYDAGLLAELLKWAKKGNFDRVSAMLVGMFDMKESINVVVKIPKPPDPNDYWNRPLYTNS